MYTCINMYIYTHIYAQAPPQDPPGALFLHPGAIYISMLRPPPRSTSSPFSTCEYMCVYMYIYTHVYTHKHICTYIYICSDPKMHLEPFFFIL